MKRRNGILVIVVVVIVALITALVGGYHNYFIQPIKTTSTCPTHFVCQPVGDIIIPKIERNYGGGISNLPLNLTRGETMNLTVSLFLEINSNVAAKFQVLTSPSNVSSAISTSFSPENLSAVANVNASSVMTIHISNSAPLGQYSTVVSFYDSADQYTWGTSVLINVESA